MPGPSLENNNYTRMVRLVAGTLALSIALVLAVRVFLGHLPPVASPIAVTIVVILTVLAVITGRVIQPAAAARIIIAVCWIGATLLSYMLGGLEGPIIVAMPIIPLIATVLINHRIGMVMGILAACSIIMFLILHDSSETGLQPGLTLAEKDVMRGGWLLFSIFIITMFVSYYGRNEERLKLLLKLQADTDFLTRIANRRKLTEKLRDEYFRSRRRGDWLSVLMLDIDHFKKLNDNFGHLMGDNCLIQIADLLQQHCRRASDLVGRYGGEEFLVLLPDTDPQEARQLAEAIRIAIQSLNIRLSSGKIPEFVTATIGCNSVQVSENIDPEQIIKTADELLYQGKAAGRNVTISNEQLPGSVSLPVRS